jgi:Holliday junction resolvasome RuvABC endonuclease subunit
MMSIDQSLSSSGVMIWDKDEVVQYKLIKTEPKGEVILRIREIIAHLSELIDTHKITKVIIEGLPFGLNSSSVRPLAALYYFIQNLCKDKGIEFYESNVTAVKKLATGSGKAAKSDMIEAFSVQAHALYIKIVRDGIKKSTGLADLADAYFIGKLQLHKESI